MKLVLITGMSGAGKSLALRTLEDSGFEAIDNLPLSLLPSVVNSANSTQNLAIGCDVRNREFSVDSFLEVIDAFKRDPNIHFHIVFLDADDETLRRRFTETRRRHPLATDRPVLDGIHLERERIEKLRNVANFVIDTSETEPTALRQMIISHFAGEKELSVTITSFSFRQGIPREADIVFDVRFLKNPHYDPELRPFTGLDSGVGAYIESDPDFADFFKRLTGLILPLLPRYLTEGKHYLTIAIGCTGGKHRSVYMVQKLGAFLQSAGYNTTLRHRDLENA